MQIGILQCDRVESPWQTTFGDYPEMFQQLLTGADASLTFQAFDLTNNLFPQSIDDCDAWLLTGSKYSVNDPMPWILRAEQWVRELHRKRRPTVGICFGHQLIARALGGCVERVDEWGVGVHTADIVQAQDWMQPSQARLSLLVSHQDQVTRLPVGAVRLAGHDFCHFDMYQIGQHILTFQGHPEFTRGYSLATMTKRRDRIGEATFEAGNQSLQQDIDSDIAARWIVQFLRQACVARDSET